MSNIEWEVGDRAYVWYARDNHNASDLKGSIVLVELQDHRPNNTWQVKILLSGYTTKWAHEGAVIYVTQDELYLNFFTLINTLESRYRDYLLSQTSRLVDHRGELDDPS